jgi:hypothetical protein
MHFGGSRAAPLGKRERVELRDLFRRSKIQALTP